MRVRACAAAYMRVRASWRRDSNSGATIISECATPTALPRARLCPRCPRRARRASRAFVQPLQGQLLRLRRPRSVAAEPCGCGAEPQRPSVVRTTLNAPAVRRLLSSKRPGRPPALLLFQRAADGSVPCGRWQHAVRPMAACRAADGSVPCGRWQRIGACDGDIAAAACRAAGSIRCASSPCPGPHAVQPRSRASLRGRMHDGGGGGGGGGSPTL